MQKFRITLCLFSLILVGCQEKIDTTGNRVGSGSPDVDQVINTHGEVENTIRLEGFISNVEQGKRDVVQIVNYTTEGDPIFYTLQYDGTKIHFEHDSSEDQFGSGEVSATECESIAKNERDGFIDYELQGCEREKTFNVLTIEK